MAPTENLLNQLLEALKTLCEGQAMILDSNRELSKVLCENQTFETKLTSDKTLEGVLKDIQGDLGRIADNTERLKQ